MQLRGAVVLVTGGGRGIGRATGELLARRGAHVVVSGRDAAALEAVARSTGATPIVADLRAESSPASLVEQVLARCGRLDAVVANAGVGAAGPVAGMSDERIAELVDVNVRAPLLLARSALAAFRQQAVAGPARSRALVFLTSIAGLVGVPGESVYSATKAAVEQFAVLVREEVRTDPGLASVTVSTVAPGVVDTEFFQRRGAPYQRRVPRPLPAGRAAAAVVAVLERGTARTVVPGWLTVPARLSQVAPRTYRALARRMS